MPKFLGMEPKTWLWVGGGLVALIVIYYVMRSRGGGGGAAAGGDTGLTGGGISGSSPVSYAPGAPDSSGDRYQQQLNDLDIQASQEALREQKAMFDLQKTQFEKQFGYQEQQFNLAFQGAQRQQEFQLGYEQSAYETAKAAQDVVTRSVKGKSKVECPKGQHLVVVADGTPMCQDKGGSGFSLKTVFSGIGDIAEGLLGGAAAAAPGIGYGAAQAAAAYGLGQAGLPQFSQYQPNTTVKGKPQQGTPYFTPPTVTTGQQGGAIRQPVPYNPMTNAGVTFL